MGWLSGVAWCAAGVGALGLTLGGLLFVFQDRLLYLPSLPIRDPDDNPSGAFTSSFAAVVDYLSYASRFSVLKKACGRVMLEAWCCGGSTHNELRGWRTE